VQAVERLAPVSDEIDVRYTGGPSSSDQART
jgi:hypothetical protein